MRIKSWAISIHKKLRTFSLATAVLAVSVGMVVAAAPASADCKDADLNVIRCGLDGSTTAAQIASFKQHYTANNPSDFRAAANWSGYSTETVTGMTTANTKAGILTQNGNVVVDGQVVARDSWISARFTKGAGFVAVPNTNGIYARKATTYAYYNKYDVLVTFDANGVAIAADIIDCGNVIKFSPVKKRGVKIEKTVSKATLNVDEEFTYTIKVTNTGNVALKNVYVHDAHPANIKFLSASEGQITELGNWKFTIPSLDVKQTKEFTIKAKVTKYVKDAIVNKACVNAPEIDPTHPVKDDACATVPVDVIQPKASVKIAKTVSEQKVEVGQEFTYTLKVTNNGDRDLKNVFVYDCQPSNIKFLGASEGKVGDVYKPTGGTPATKPSCKGWSFTIPQLATQESKTFTIKAKVTKYVKDAIVNKACVNAPAVHPDTPRSDDDCANVPVKVKPLVYACDGDVAATVNPSNQFDYAISTKITYSPSVSFKDAKFDFGDKKSVVVDKENPAKTISASHTYAEAGTYNVRITLHFVVDGKTVTAAQVCKKKVTVSNPFYSCKQLSGSPLEDVLNGYNFVASMEFGNGVTFKGADFDFGDGQTVKDLKSDDGKTIQVDHTYAASGEYTVSAMLHFDLNGKDVTAATCKALAKGVVQPECKPGIPVGDVRCNPCKYDVNISADDAECKPPVVSLPNTGTGGIIAIGAAAIIGGFLAYKHILLRNHKTALAALAEGKSVAQQALKRKHEE